jgi:hypothetical protein
MKIHVAYEIPDGDICTVIEDIEGCTIANYNHCRFRSSTHKQEDGKYHVYCNLFNKDLDLREDVEDSGMITYVPYKCDQCTQSAYN